MKAKKFILVVFMLAITSTSAWAVIPVTDYANLMQNLLNYIQIVNNALNTYRTVSNQLTQLQNESHNLTKFNQNYISTLGRSLSDMAQVNNQVRGIVFDAQQAAAQFDAAYPSAAASGVSGAQFSARLAQWNASSKNAIVDAVRAQGIVKNTNDDTVAMNALVNASQSSVGALSALQAGNQIAALQVKQTMQLETIMAQSQRAQTAYIAEQNARQEAARKRDFMGGGWSEKPSKQINLKEFY